MTWEHVPPLFYSATDPVSLSENLGSSVSNHPVSLKKLRESQSRVSCEIVGISAGRPFHRDELRLIANRWKTVWRNQIVSSRKDLNIFSAVPSKSIS